jgi:hypothetical protein
LKGWLVFRKGSADLQTVDFTVERYVGSGVLAKPFVFGGGLAAVLFLLRHWTLRRRFREAGRAGPNLGDRLRTGEDTWTFDGSWASNFTAVGALLGTLLTSKDFLSDALSGLSLTAFLGLSLFFGFLALLAPIAFAAASNAGHGTYGGLMLAGFLTTAAAAGQLASIAIMLSEGAVETWGAVVVALGYVTLGIYAWRSIADLVVPTWRTDVAAPLQPQPGRKSPIL